MKALKRNRPRACGACRSSVTIVVDACVDQRRRRRATAASATSAIAPGAGTALGAPAELNTHPSHEPFDTARSPNPMNDSVHPSAAAARVQ
jgi:hypothetical protein